MAKPATDAAAQPVTAIAHSLKYETVVNTRSATTSIQAPTAATSDETGVNDPSSRPTPNRIHDVKSEPATVNASKGRAMEIERCEVIELTTRDTARRGYSPAESQN